jgi:hypothetical protein
VWLAYGLLTLSLMQGSFPVPSRADFVRALREFTGKSVSVADIRRLSCEPIGGNEPTEAVCEWSQRSANEWRRFSTYVAVDGAGWHLIDETAPKSQPGVEPSEKVAAFVRRMLDVSSYKRADADLNGDGRSEVLVYVTDRSYCGSGGCTLLILSPQQRSYRVVLRSTVTQLPIWSLATSTHGWRDIGVTVAGGGIDPPYVARLRFNGRRYPSNPTIPPAVPLKRPSGKVLISG